MAMKEIYLIKEYVTEISEYTEKINEFLYAILDEAETIEVEESEKLKEYINKLRKEKEGNRK